MFFRLIYTVKPLHLANADQLDFEMSKNGHTITINLSKIPAEKRIKEYGPEDRFVSAITQIELNSKREKQFAEINSPLSNSVKEYVKPIRILLDDAIKQFTKVYRWRLRNENATNPIRFGSGLAYSQDSKLWKELPDQRSLMSMFGLPVPQEFSSDELSSVSTLITDNIHEPLGHELLQEAWELRRTNPRSSLIIGLAAAETGFKEFSSRMVPAASWLIENVQSPPLVKMLENFLPQIPTKLNIYGKILAPPEKLLDLLIKGVSIRNLIVHGKKADIHWETVEEILHAVRDLLYLLDFYSGHRWAWSHVNPAYLTELVRTAQSLTK